MILECLVTTEDDAGRMHVAPMGPHVDEGLNRWTLKPFQSSTTYAHLKLRPRAVVHVIDDSWLLAQALLGQANTAPADYRGDIGYVLREACHWYALRFDHIQDTSPRATFEGTLVGHAVQRPHRGWNRAQFAVLELAILVSRRHLLPAEQLRAEVERWQTVVDKTAGERDRAAFELLRESLAQSRPLEQDRS